MAARHHAAAQGSGDQAGQGSRPVAVIDDATCRRGVKPRGWHRGAAHDLTKSGSGQARWTCGLTRTPRITDEVTHAADSIFNLAQDRSEEHTSELQSLMRISYAAFSL